MPRPARKARNHQAQRTPPARDPNLTVPDAQLPAALIVPIAGSSPPPAAGPGLELAPSSARVRLDLACGQAPREGFEGVDLLAPNARKVDLLKFPWPWADDSVDELHCSHFVEHIDCRAVEARDLVDPNPQMVDRYVGVDMFFAFFDEAWRVLKHDGTFKVICPALRSNRAFQDPTHRRFIASETFAYLNRPWRESVGLSHYRVRANFNGACNHTIPVEMSLLSAEAQARRFAESWNVIHDWVADLVAVKK